MELMDVVMSICAAALVIPYLFAWFSKRMNTEALSRASFAAGRPPLLGPSSAAPGARLHLGRPALLPGRLSDRPAVRQSAHPAGDRGHLLFPKNSAVRKARQKLTFAPYP